MEKTRDSLPIESAQNRRLHINETPNSEKPADKLKHAAPNQTANTEFPTEKNAMGCHTMITNCLTILEKLKPKKIDQDYQHKYKVEDHQEVSNRINQGVASPDYADVNHESCELQSLCSNLPLKGGTAKDYPT